MAFQGSLKELPLPDIIQLVSVSGKTGVFELRRNGDSTGEIYLRGGRGPSTRAAPGPRGPPRPPPRPIPAAPSLRTSLVVTATLAHAGAWWFALRRYAVGTTGKVLFFQRHT